MYLFLEAPKKNNDDNFNPMEKDAEVKKKDDKSNDKPISDNKINKDDTKHLDKVDVDDSEANEDPEDDAGDLENNDNVDDENNDNVDDENNADSIDANFPKIKKFKLINEYDKLLRVGEELRDTINKLELSDLDSKELTIYKEMRSIIEENIENLKYVILDNFDSLSYESLLTIYIATKSSIKTISEILIKISENKNK